MKLRIRGNSIRLRLTRPEVKEFARTGRVLESVDFGEGKRAFAYVLEASRDTDVVTAKYEDDRLVVIVPATRGAEWANSENVGIEGDGIPSILIEKDFACLKPGPGEEDGDMFPNPGDAEC